jgi:branched-chain amino acid transport system permease protein
MSSVLENVTTPKGKVIGYNRIFFTLAWASFLLPPFVLSPYANYLLTSIFITALFATSLNFVLGYGGLLQFHHAVPFGVGAYASAIILTKTQLPFLLAIVAGPVAAALIALFIGWFCVRLRGLYFGMLTLALGQLVWAIIYRWNALTGGDDGIHAVPIPEVLSSPTIMYYVAFLTFSICLLALFVLVKSPFGLILKASRDNSVRAEGIGVNVRVHQLIAFVIAGFFAGIAGVVFVLMERSVTPSMLYWNKSAEVLIMCLIGGFGTFLGPSLGAAILVILSMVIGVYTDYWLLVLGSILLASVLFLPQGILGVALDLVQKVKHKTAPKDRGGEI